MLYSKGGPGAAGVLVSAQQMYMRAEEEWRPVYCSPAIPSAASGEVLTPGWTSGGLPVFFRSSPSLALEPERDCWSLRTLPPFWSSHTFQSGACETEAQTYFLEVSICPPFLTSQGKSAGFCHMPVIKDKGERQ